MLIIFIRSSIIFVVLLAILRLMGKRQIGEMQPYELVITLLIAELACIPMADVSIPLLYGIVAILAMFVLHQAVALIERSGKTAKRIISGKPSVVINRNGVDFEELYQNDLDVEDLIESIRSAGFFSIADLEYGIFEASGTFSCLPKKGVDQKPPTLPLLLISSGKLHKDNLTITKIDTDTLQKLIEKHGYKRFREVEILTVDNFGNVYLQSRGKPYVLDTLQLTEGATW